VKKTTDLIYTLDYYIQLVTDVLGEQIKPQNQTPTAPTGQKVESYIIHICYVDLYFGNIRQFHVEPRHSNGLSNHPSDDTKNYDNYNISIICQLSIATPQHIMNMIHMGDYPEWERDECHSSRYRMID
jgi:hypothetical protein